MLPEPTFNSFLLLGGILCAIGAGGVFVRRHLVTVLLSIDLMFLGVALTFAAGARYLGRLDGQIVAVALVAVGACQLALGLIVALVCVRQRHSLDPDEVTDLRW